MYGTIRLIALALLCGSFLAAQPADDTQLKQVIIFGRHGVRTPNLPNTALDTFSALPFPTFSVPGVSALTVNGGINETILGGYFRLWLTQQGMLTGNDSADANFIYFRADDLPLITDTAKAFAVGMLPNANVTIDTYTPPANDPLFSSVAAGVASIDYPTAVAAVQGRLGDDPTFVGQRFRLRARPHPLDFVQLSSQRGSAGPHTGR